MAVQQAIIAASFLVVLKKKPAILKVLSVLLLFTQTGLIYPQSVDNRSSESISKTDVCILGGSEAAFTAAIQSARMGKQVVLIAPTGHPGGMMVEGIVKDIRFGSSVVIGGITRELYRAIEAYYGRTPDFSSTNWYSKYEPSVAEQIIESFLAREKNIRIIRHTRILEHSGVHISDRKIKSINLENGETISASVFIDASIEGHLIHFAGISTETFREGIGKYGESKNGIQTTNNYRQFQVQVDPYVVPGDSSSGLIATIQSGELGKQGSPDKHIMGFCFRLCLTRRSENIIPIEKPEHYNPETYEIYRRYIAAGGQLFSPRVNRENGKTDLGSWHDLSANLYGENWEYPDGDYATQARIVQHHRDFTQGLIWFLQNDDAVDDITRKNWVGWGLCKDEFTDNGGWPRRLYIRSARRLVSACIITQHHTERSRQVRTEDPVAIAFWPPDTHHARRIVRDGYAYNEGFVFGGDDWRPFGISWRACIPKKTACTNLLTPTCVSSSYVAYGAIRILPTFMILGQSIGCAAALAVDENVAVQDLSYTTLRTKLIDAEQILTIPGDWEMRVESEK
ncbi:MAG: FAD-dependent oxidoreductase [Saprospiraceae bacterium]|nr:FAD-dependent oxidoreductase [Saprospiraceae bacterium]